MWVFGCSDGSRGFGGMGEGVGKVAWRCRLEVERGNDCAVNWN